VAGAFYIEPQELPLPTDAEIAAALGPRASVGSRAQLVRALAQRLGLEERVLSAIIKVEAGQGLVNGVPVIRLEVHHLQKLASGAARAAVDARFRVLGSKKKPWEGHQWKDESGIWHNLHTGQSLEWRAYRYARTLDPVAAMASTSWGLGQVLGENWRRLGYRSPDDFLAAQATESGQLDTFGRFLTADAQLFRAAQNRDWTTLARLYNGAANVAVYSKKLRAAYG